MNQLANEHQASSRKTDTLVLRIFVFPAIEVSDEAAGLRKGDRERNTPRGPLPTDVEESMSPLWAPAPWLAPSVQEEEEGELQVWHPGSCGHPSKAS